MSERGLRQRKKAAAMSHIQKTALELFTERGFTSVTVEEIASAAGFSPSTVYRHFGTKEGIVVRDEHDDRAEQLIERELATLDQSLGEAIRKVLDAINEEQFVTERDVSMARIRLCLQVETLRAASVLEAAKASLRYADLIHRLRSIPIEEARILSSAIVSAIFSALVNWYGDGADRPWIAYCSQALDMLEGTLASY
ncbi:MAG: TetR/AcrR family transcriptional regulator [Actinomycetaceae bacterium]|nr:TetR/AcrR family transcriptional regulator [Actinomycetaceae bacterium]